MEFSSTTSVSVDIHSCLGVNLTDFLPYRQDLPSNKINIKIADYGISRVTLPSGIKGFGGTEGFMAPEIMKHNGEEEYTEKVSGLNIKKIFAHLKFCVGGLFFIRDVFV